MRTRPVIVFVSLLCLGSVACQSPSSSGQSLSESSPAENPEQQDETSQSGDESASTSSDESKASTGNASELHPALLDPSTLEAQQAPESFRVQFETTEGNFVVECHREWAPIGVDRFYNLVRIGFYEDVAFFRVIENFMAQFGLHGDPRVNEAWRDETIQDDPVEKSNKEGYVTFAMGKEPNSRSTQIFINYTDNSKLDEMGFAPIGQVVEGMDVVRSIHAGYGDGPPRGNGPDQQAIVKKGNAYLDEEFPRLDDIEQATIVDGSASDRDSAE